MASTPESKAKAQIIKDLKRACLDDGWIIDIETHAGDAYSTPTLDITGTLAHPLRRGWGVPFAIEVKRFDGKGKITERQLITMRNKAEAGVAVFLIDSPGTLTDFILWIKAACPPRPYTAGN